MQSKQNLASALGIPQKNFFSDFSEIIKLQCGKKTPYIALYFAAFFGFLELLLFNYLRKMRGYPNFLFGFQ